MKKHKNMKTFESCNRVWLTMPEDGKSPPCLTGFARILTNAEKDQRCAYNGSICPVEAMLWDYSWAGWYPVHADGTDDHETAKQFITDYTFTPRPPRKREIRRRFRLSTR